VFVKRFYVYLSGHIFFSRQLIPIAARDEIRRSIPSRASSGAKYKNKPPTVEALETPLKYCKEKNCTFS
jgi:hypothetical protein